MLHLAARGLRSAAISSRVNAAASPTHQLAAAAVRRRGVSAHSSGSNGNGGSGGSGATSTTAAAAAPAATAATTSVRPRVLGTGPADLAEAQALLDGVDTLILDCDGVLWTGSHQIPRAAEALAVMRKRGKRLRFVTNNSSKSRAAYVEKFAALGIEATASEVVSSSYMAAAYLESIGFPSRRAPGGGGGAPAKALLLGPRGVEEELAAAGVVFVTPRDLQLPPVLDTPDAMLALDLDPAIGAVVVGWDPRFNYSAVVYASACLRELPDCQLVATNLDDFDHIGRGRTMPGTGCLVRAVEVASGKTAVNVGKGGPWLFPFLAESLGLDPARTAVVGDRLDTDIALAREGGMLAILPRTGVSTVEDALAAAPDRAPHAVVPSIAALAGLAV